MALRVPAFCSRFLAGSMFALQSVAGQAEIVSTERLLDPAGVEVQREQLKGVLDRDEAREKLKALGVEPELAKKRVDAMTAEEVRMVSERINTLPAGGDLSVRDLLIIILVVLLVALIV
ncbi:MAG: hypothetical protein KatS3mg123_2436 [Burkholderiales bacterium]|nr:MAG: hypothetical protein KatS3mg123_2436 [Burkholderiales bacterium]